MKPNPKLLYFVENKICNTKDTPYILLEEGDKEKIQTLIKETASNKSDRDNFLGRLEEDELIYGFAIFPFRFLKQIIQNLNYGKRRSGRTKVWELQMQLFPNYEELQKVHWLEKSVSDYHDSLESIEEGLKELTELSKPTKETN